MANTIDIPRILVYEEFDGHPIYRKGYRDFMLGIKQINEINMGSSILQSFIINIILNYFNKIQSGNFLTFSSELGLNIAKNSNFAADIAIFEKQKIKINLNSTIYSDIPPKVVIEVDIKAEESDYFQNEEEYFHLKTEKLLQWGVEKVIWVFSKSKKVLVADNLKTWTFNSWDLPFNIVENYEINLWDEMIANGFEV
jgi:Putative restriction endonuclease